MADSILSAASERRLRGVHPDLVAVVRRAAVLCRTAGLPIVVLEGLRTPERQRALVASGASTTLRSRHLTGHAVDLAPLVDGKVRWDWPAYDRLGPIVKAAAAEQRVPVEWGGDWKGFRDGPHFQLPWGSYP